MNIPANLKRITSELPEHVTLVAVSKTKPNEDIMAAYEAGHRVFGENKVQEMTDKYEALPKDIEWHMIGHVQSNKIKYMAPFVSLIHGVDRMKLLKEINKQGKKHHRVIDCLLQIKIAEEDSKFGMTAEKAEEILKSDALATFEYVNIKGVMGMATFTDDEAQVRKEFSFLKSCFDNLKTFQNTNCHLEVISMGMSGDYQMAVACGSNMVRIGSSIFGERD